MTEDHDWIDDAFVASVGPEFGVEARRREGFAVPPHEVVDGPRFRALPTGTPTVSVVIPARNEASNVAHVLRRVPEWVDEVVLVDGASTDDTIEVAKATWPGLTVVHQVGNGKGAALREGFEAARGDIIVMLDADGSTDPAEIPRFVAALRTGADFAKGTRFVTGGGSADLTRMRSWGNRVLVHVVNTLWRTHHTDLCYGYMAFWRRCLRQVDLDCDGFEIETLLVLRFLRAKIRIVEVPSFETPRFTGVSNLRVWRDGLRIVRTIIAERLRPVPVRPSSRPRG